MEDVILLRRENDIATVVLNNPDKLNVISTVMWRRLARVMEELSADDALRCVVLRGAGDKAFAAGADIDEFAQVRDTFEQGKVYHQEIIHRALKSVAECRHPTIAMIHGVCVGGGLEIASQCDLRICGESSRFGVPINRLGFAMAYGELSGLLALAGRAVTLEILLEGRVFGAGEAYEKRLVTRVVPDDKVEEEACACARRIAEGAPLVARWHKQFIRRLTPQPEPLTAAEIEENFAYFNTEDYRIGYRAFRNRQKPRFIGR